MTAAPDILLVIATIVTGLSLISAIVGWVDRRWPPVALVALAMGLGLFSFVHVTTDGGLRPRDVADAFVTVAARLLN